MVRSLARMGIAVIALAMFVGSARAEAGALLKPITEANVSDQDSLTAQQAVISYFAQFPDAIPITPPDESIRRAGPEFRSCGDASCAQAFAIKLDVDFAVVLRLFAPDRRNGPASLSCALVTPDGAAYSGNVDIGDAGVHAAAIRAAQLAYERLSRGPGPWLKVDGPDGSRVRVDGRVPQAVPYMEKTEPGLHRIVVESPAGSLLYDGTITLPDDPAHYEQLQIENKAPQAIDSGAIATEVPNQRDDSFWSRKRSKWNYIIGAPLAALGLAYTITGIIHYTEKGNCVQGPPGEQTCNVVNGNSKASLGLGIAGIVVGGGLFMGVGIIREHGTAPTGASLQYRGSF
ncbi:MAG: hypothetical protein QM778_29805 [Myxococcales bacterium]